MSNAKPVGFERRCESYLMRGTETPRQRRRLRRKDLRENGNTYGDRDEAQWYGGKLRPTPRQRKPRRDG